MTLRNRLESPRLVLRLGLLFLLLFNLWPRFLPLTFNLGPDSVDAVRGFLFGVSAGLLLWAVRLTCRQQRCGDAR